jgi:hypothetical protein
MDSQGTRSKVIEMLIQQEELIAEIYKTYSEKFSEHEGLWLDLATEEVEHSLWIRLLHARSKDGSVEFKGDRFKMDILQFSLRYLKHQLEEAQKQEISLLDALEIAWDIENSLLEKRFFEIFKEDSEELRKILTDLTVSTSAHRERVGRYLEKHKRIRRSGNLPSPLE